MKRAVAAAGQSLKEGTMLTRVDTILTLMASGAYGVREAIAGTDTHLKDTSLTESFKTHAMPQTKIRAKKGTMMKKTLVGLSLVVTLMSGCAVFYPSPHVVRHNYEQHTTTQKVSYFRLLESAQNAKHRLFAQVGCNYTIVEDGIGTDTVYTTTLAPKGGFQRTPGSLPYYWATYRCR